MLRQKPDEFRQLGKFLDLGNVLQVAGQNRCQIGPRPIPASPFALAADRLGEAAKQREADEFVANDRLPVALKLPRKQALQEGGRSARYFSARQRQHLDGFDPAGQAVGDPGQGESIGGSG
jgi:hypothetical protein